MKRLHPNQVAARYAALVILLGPPVVLVALLPVPLLAVYSQPLAVLAFAALVAGSIIGIRATVRREHRRAAEGAPTDLGAEMTPSEWFWYLMYGVGLLVLFQRPYVLAAIVMLGLVGLVNFWASLAAALVLLVMSRVLASAGGYLSGENRRRASGTVVLTPTGATLPLPEAAA